MFRLFLIDRLQSGLEKGNKKEEEKPALPPKRLRNRRVFERFNIDTKHLALMNEQDILLVRDVSQLGFSTEVSKRGFERLKKGDIYQCRLRYLNEIFTLKTKVTWKVKQFVGFEIVKPSQQVKRFMNRLIKPVEIGVSMEEVDKSLVNQDEESSDKRWFHASSGTDLFTWQEEDELKAWRLEDQAKFINWTKGDGIRTGKVKSKIKTIGVSDPWTNEYQNDDLKDPNLEQFAIDVFMAMQIDQKEKLLKTLTE